MASRLCLILFFAKGQEFISLRITQKNMPGKIESDGWGNENWINITGSGPQNMRNRLDRCRRGRMTTCPIEYSDVFFRQNLSLSLTIFGEVYKENTNRQTWALLNLFCLLTVQLMPWILFSIELMKQAQKLIFHPWGEWKYKGAWIAR